MVAELNQGGVAVYAQSVICCNKVKLSPWKGSMYHAGIMEGGREGWEEEEGRWGGGGRRRGRWEEEEGGVFA